MDAGRDEGYEVVLDKILGDIHRTQTRGFFVLVTMIVGVFLTGLLIRWCDMTTLLSRIDAMKQFSNSNSVNVQREPTAIDLAREILRKDGKVD